MAKSKKDIIVENNLTTNAKSTGSVIIGSRIANGLEFSIFGEKHLINGTNQVTIDRDQARVFNQNNHSYSFTYVSQEVADYLTHNYKHLFEDHRLVIGDKVNEVEAKAKDGLDMQSDIEKNNPNKSLDQVNVENLKDIKADNS